MFREAYRWGHWAASHSVFKDPETRHNLSVEALHRIEENPLLLKALEFYFSEGRGRFEDKRLRTELAGGKIVLPNPVMIGAGVDKNGRMVRALATVGAGAVEGGTFLYLDYAGNSYSKENPRLHVPRPGVLINRFGFNSDGVINRRAPEKNVKAHLSRYEKDSIVLGINVGISNEIMQKYPKSLWPKIFAWTAACLYKEGDYFVINVSSPNTEGLRKLQDKKYLVDIIQEIFEVMDKKGGRKPLYVKLSPDLARRAVDDVVKIVLENRLAGTISANTTIDTRIKASLGKQWAEIPGGVSGDNPHYKKLARMQLRHIYQETGGSIDTIGVGAINSFEDGLGRIIAGASAIQVVTCLTQGSPGPFFPNEFNRKLAHWMEQQGIDNISQIRGFKNRV